MLIQSNVLSQDIHSFPLPNSSSLEDSYTGSFKDSLSFHFLSIKVKTQKQTIVLPFIVNEKKEVEKLPFLSFDKQQTFIGHFYDENNYYLMTTNKSNKKAFLTEINIDTKEYKISNIDDYNKKAPKFILEDKIVFVDISEKKMSFKTISPKGSIDKIVNIDDYNSGLSRFEIINTDYIDQTNYVKWGSLKEKKVYHIDDFIYFTSHGYESPNSKVYSINLKEDTPKINKLNLKNNTIKKLRDYNSYAFENFLLTIASNKEEFELDIYNLKNGELIKKISSKDDYFSKDSYKLESFLKNLKRSYNDITISANKTVEGNFLVRIEAVNENYNIDHGWWFHQQFMQNIINQNNFTQPKFTPNPDYYEDSSLVYNDDFFYEFVINENGEILNNADSKIIFDLYDTSYYLSKLKDNRKIENISGDTTGSKFYAIGFDKKAKEVKILTKRTLNY